MSADPFKDAIEAEMSGNYPRVIELLTPLARAGNAEAQFKLGHLYFTEAEVSRESATEWLGLAAAQNHPEALYWLACLSRSDGWVGTPDNLAGLHLLKQAAEKGSHSAQRDLGCMYATGEGVTKDLELARNWYEMAAKAGNAEAQFDFGFMLLLGEGGPIDVEKGINFLELAATAGDYQAAKLLADCFENGWYGSSANEEAAQKWRLRERELAQIIRAD